MIEITTRVRETVSIQPAARVGDFMKRVQGMVLALVSACVAPGCSSLETTLSPTMVVGEGVAADHDLAGWTPNRSEHCAGLAKGKLTEGETAAYGRALARTLARRGVDVALVFHQSALPRAMMPPNVRYVHGGIWLRQDSGASRQPSYITYGLLPGFGRHVPCRTSKVAELPVEDFTHNITALDSSVIVPTPEIQAKIRAIIESKAYEGMHNPRFALTANPRDEQFQNCAGLILHVVVAAWKDTTDPVEVNRVIGQTFTPSRMRVSLPVRALGPLVSSRLSSADQPWRISTASYESIDAFMKAEELTQQSFVFYLDPRGGPKRWRRGSQDSADATGAGH